MPSIRPIFEYLDYKSYLNDLIQSKPKGGRGERNRLALALRCHPAYISLVFNGAAHFSLEQAQLLADYLGHSEEEAHFFLLLLQLSRAGTPKLRDYFLKQIERAIQKRTVLKERLEYKKTLSAEDQAVYYSSWIYPTAHMMLTVPGLQSRAAIQKYLGLPPSAVSEALEFMISRGLASENGGKLRTGTTSIHLGQDSPMATQAHTQWRLRALSSLDRRNGKDLHYSSAVSMAAKDLPAVKAVLVKAIEEIRAIVKNSPEEDIYCYTLDLFSLQGGTTG